MFPSAVSRLVGLAGRRGWSVILAGLLLAAGCATPALDRARNSFYAGQYREAESILNSAGAASKDEVLFRMERGMALQEAGDYAGSAREFIAASDRLEELETYSLSKGATSLVVNDNVQDFMGAPYERTLLHSFTAKNHLALAHWDDAGVEARRIIKSLSPDVRQNYPDDAYSRYMAGFCLEMIDDASNAEQQYRRASELLGTAAINPETGHFVARLQTNDLAAAWQSNDLPIRIDNPAETNAGKTVSLKKKTTGKRDDARINDLLALETDKPWENELVCFILAGRAPGGYEMGSSQWEWPAYTAEIYCDGRLLGHSQNLADTANLAYATEQIDALRKALKTAARVAIKEGIAQAVEAGTNNSGWGDLTRLILIGLLEQPDVRRWETLPRWLGVARVPCPPDLKEFDVVFKSAYGVTMRTVHVTSPIQKRRNVFVSFCRDLPVRGVPATAATNMATTVSTK